MSCLVVQAEKFEESLRSGDDHIATINLIVYVSLFCMHFMQRSSRYNTIVTAEDAKKCKPYIRALHHKHQILPVL